MENAVYEEFDHLERAISSFLLVEHFEDGTHNLEPAGLGFVPIGTCVVWPGSIAPAAWHACNGDAIERGTFSALFALIGVVYGPGDGSTTFNLPTQAAPFGIYIIFTGLGS
jgi:hypothetical protein